jgi:fatty-acyl-CoA synthase
MNVFHPPGQSATDRPPTGRASFATTITESLRRGADAGRAVIFLDHDRQPRVVPLTDMRASSERAATALAGAYGVAPGERVCFYGPTTPALVCAMLAAWRIGAVTVVLPLPRRSQAATNAGDVRRRMDAAESRLLLAAPPLLEAVAAQLPGLDVADVTALPGCPGVTLPPEPAPADLALLQFTSGTTAASRAVPIRHGPMVANPASVVSCVGQGAGDMFVSWLPLYHDMGVMSLAGSISAGMNVCLMATETFVQDPGIWMHAVASYRGTLTAGPNFAYGLAARLLALQRNTLDLSSLRCAINGAEAVDPAIVRRFTALAGQHGMAAEAVCPMYGLAEATLAVTFTRPDAAVRCLRTARDTLEPGQIVADTASGDGRELVSCGRPLPGTEVVITSDDGRPVPAGQVGEVRVAGPGVAAGYWTADGATHPNPLRDRSGRLMTGDYGFLADGELYICGRKKDMIVVGGRNLYPEDYESATERLRGVRMGNVIAFSLPDTERMVVVAETPLHADGAQQLGRDILAALSRELSYAPHEAVLIPPGSLPKTSSGKRRRQHCRALYESGDLQVLAVAR